MEFQPWESEVKALQKEVEKDLRRREKDLYNRIRSIQHDAAFVSSVAQALPGLPVVANLRCGAWYTDPRITKSSCYFKSTDGHAGQWQLSLKRHNLGLTRLILRHSGCIIVDSTRSGKTMPDALSKTIPIWCAVLNLASELRYGSTTTASQNTTQFASLRTPDNLVSASENAQIASRIQAFATSLLDSDLTVPRLPLPLRPFFLTTNTDLDELQRQITQRDDDGQPFFLPVVLLSASRARSQTATDALTQGSSWPINDPYSSSSFQYVQGSGDDHENWAQGLTPALFWHSNHHGRIVSASRGADIEELVRDIVQDSRCAAWHDFGISSDHRSRTWQVGKTGVWLGTTPRDGQDSDFDQFAIVVLCDGSAQSQLPTQSEEPGTGVIRLSLKQGKAGVTQFGKELPRILSALIKKFVRKHQEAENHEKCSILICDSSGRDLSPALAVSLLSACFGPDQTFLLDEEARHRHQAQLDKDQIRRRLQWLMESAETVEPDQGDDVDGAGIPTPGGGAGPARAYLNRVNAVLLAASRKPDYE